MEGALAMNGTGRRQLSQRRSERAATREGSLDKKIVGLVGAMAAVAPVAAQAASVDPMAAASYADLLKPIPNAVETLRASDLTLRDGDTAKVEAADYFYRRHHHHFFHRRFYHHHHHHHFFRRRFYHHHHHFY